MFRLPVSPSCSMAEHRALHVPLYTILIDIRLQNKELILTAERRALLSSTTAERIRSLEDFSASAALLLKGMRWGWMVQNSVTRKKTARHISYISRCNNTGDCSFSMACCRSCLFLKLTYTLATTTVLRTKFFPYCCFLPIDLCSFQLQPNPSSKHCWRWQNLENSCWSQWRRLKGGLVVQIQTEKKNRLTQRPASKWINHGWKHHAMFWSCKSTMRL